MPRPRVARLIALAGVALVLPVSACSGLEGPGGASNTPPAPASIAPSASQTGPGTPTSTGTPTSSASGLTATPGPTPAAGQPTPAAGGPVVPGQLGDPVTSRTASADGRTLTLEVYPVLRAGAVSHLNLAISAPGSGTDTVSLRALLSDGNASTSDRAPFTADGLQLVDGRNGKLYLVASNGQGQCLCSRELSIVRAGESSPVLISATFAAPPPDVTTVDVRIPSFGTVTGVPVQ